MISYGLIPASRGVAGHARAGATGPRQAPDYSSGLVTTGARLCQHPGVSSTAPDRPRRLSPVRREGARVMPLELFFDLVFVLAITQCTALMADDPTWAGVPRRS